jgi:hypothetical protein
MRAGHLYTLIRATNEYIVISLRALYQDHPASLLSYAGAHPLAFGSVMGKKEIFRENMRICKFFELMEISEKKPD